MPLPFLAKPKNQNAGVITEHRKPDQKDEGDQEDSTGIEECVRDLFEAAKTDDIKRGCRAIKDAFAILDSEPHEEGEHTNEDYDSLNEQAAQEK